MKNNNSDKGWFSFLTTASGIFRVCPQNCLISETFSQQKRVCWEEKAAVSICSPGQCACSQHGEGGCSLVYGSSLASKDRICNYVHMITLNYVLTNTNLSLHNWIISVLSTPVCRWKQRERVIISVMHLACVCFCHVLSQWKCLLIFIRFVRLYTIDLYNYVYLRIVKRLEFSESAQ